MIIDKIREHPLPRPLGEVAEHSEDGEGKSILSFKKRHTAFPLSVACGDSSPKGRAKDLHHNI